MPRPFRTFVAVEAEDAVRREAGRLMGRLARTQAGVKWTAPEQLHVTLSFLGDVEGTEINDICRRVAGAVADLKEFQIEVAGVGAFPDVERPRTVWLGVTEGAAEMVVMQGRIEESLRTLGFRPEARRFTPHLTIGRVRSLPRGDASLTELLRKDKSFVCGRMTVREAIVFSSVLGRDGPTYEVLGRGELLGG